MKYVIKEEKTVNGLQYLAYRLDIYPLEGRQDEEYITGTAASTLERCEVKLRLTLNPEGRTVKELEID